VVRRERIALLYSTGPPFSNHIVGACLKKITERPLILDFRDAWTANPARRMRYAGARQRIESMLERFVVRSADLIVCTTEGITEHFRRRYEREADARFITLPNGYDREDYCMSCGPERGPGDKMRIVHTGHLRLERSPKPLLVALRQLLTEEPDLEAALEVHLVGEIQRFLDGRTIHDYLKELQLESVVTLVGHVPQPEAIRYQTTADVLLLIIGAVPPEETSTYGVASKVFEYMLAGRPVLTLADPGPVSDLVARTRIGPAFATSDIDGIKRYLSDALAAFRQGRLEVKSNQAEIERYDFRNLTLQLLEEWRQLTQAC
jgi:glycosyltransferase involved in cell wall biosynthesis